MVTPTHLKTRVLVPLALVLLGLSAAYTVGFYVEEREHVTEEFRERLLTTERSYQAILQREAGKLGAALSVIITRADLQAALAVGDREVLLARTLPLFRQFQADYAISHFYFSDARRVNLLRVHQPDRHGDRIDRYTTLAAERTGKPAWGVELGPLGTFTLRQVFPWDANGVRIGYVELGWEIDGILRELPKRFGMEYAIVLDKRRLHRQGWEAGMALLARDADWNRLPHGVVAGESLPGIPARLLTAPVGDGQPLSLGERSYRAASLPLIDAAGERVGHILLLHDLSARYDSLRTVILRLVGVSLVVGAGLLVFFSGILARVGRDLDQSQRGLAAAAEARHAEQARHIDELEGQRARVEQANREWTTAFSAVEDLMFMHDAEMRILRANRAYLERAGLPFDAVLGRRYWEVFPPLAGPLESCLRARECIVSEAETLELASGEVYQCSSYAIQDSEGGYAYSLHVMRDVTEHMRYERELERQANYDALTGLANRNLLNDRIRQALVHVPRSRFQAAVLLFDLDRFKVVNDSLGHGAGDVLLGAVAHRLLEHVREGDTVARLGGDEFVVVLERLEGKDDVVILADRMLKALQAPFRVDGQEVHASASLGIALCPQDGDTPEALLKNADAAMYQAKRGGGNSFHFFTQAMNTWATRQLETENALRHALARDELTLHYQPKIDLSSGRIGGAEALIRWRHPERGLVPPAEFIPLAEETGLIVPIGEWVIETACAQIRAWQDAGLPPVRVAINLSARQFRQNNLFDVIGQSLRVNGLAPGLLEFELTESMLMQDPEDAVAVLGQLKALGVGVALDDFGTGYSSLAYLKRFPIDTLKIDRSFVRDIVSDPDDAAIVLSIISFAHSMQLGVVAEGVETAGQLQFLRHHRCNAAQGFYFSRPLEAGAFSLLLGDDAPACYGAPDGAVTLTAAAGEPGLV